MKLIMHEDRVQLMPETQLDVEILERWNDKRFQSSDMPITAMATGVKRYPYGLSIRLVEGQERNKEQAIIRQELRQVIAEVRGFPTRTIIQALLDIVAELVRHEKM